MARNQAGRFRQAGPVLASSWAARTRRTTGPSCVVGGSGVVVRDLLDQLGPDQPARAAGGRPVLGVVALAGVGALKP